MENEGGIRFFGIIPVIFVLGGFLPQYYEIFRKAFFFLSFKAPLFILFFFCC